MQQIFQQYQAHTMDPKMQEQLNTPLVKSEGLGKKDASFLEVLITKLKSGELDPFNPQTLFNHDVYDKLSEEDQERTDLTAINLMSVIKQIETLWNQSHQPGFQLQNLVDTVFQMKSRFEEKHGDVFVI
ncbi:hypothetical protein COY07_03935 [Candidatus Peregrinibacteria bacterium CG_4_10_14_0_2_um_filter_43_11]|nr:MAG: hypothetical protein COY07_03935 [Candidatus Peregrinibacteria bacterium CG_4_10_14_0_2_um_filter_43_11]